MKNGKSYTFSGDLSNVNANVVRAFVTNDEVAVGTTVTRVSNIGNNGTYTNSNNYKYLVLEFLDVSTYQGNWQIEQGSTATTYEPYHTPVSYQLSLGEHKFYGIGTYRDYILRTTGKNLYNKNTDYVGGVYSDSGSWNGNVPAWTTSDWIEVSSNKQYVLSSKTTGTNNMFFSEFDESKTFIQRTTTNNLVPTSNTKYVRLSFKNDIGTYDIMLEEGSTALDYQPYGVGNWYKVGKIGEVVYDGTEDWTLNSGLSNANRTVFFTVKPSDFYNYTDISSNILALSNKFIATSQSATWKPYEVGYTKNTASRINFIVAPNTTMENFVTIIKGTTFNYAIDNPTYTQITGTLAEQLEAWYNAQSIKGTTIIESNGDLPLIIKVRALKGE